MSALKNNVAPFVLNEFFDKLKKSELLIVYTAGEIHEYKLYISHGPRSRAKPCLNVTARDVDQLQATSWRTA